MIYFKSIIFILLFTVRLFATSCCDGSYSSSTGRGTCSHHGGVCSGGGGYTPSLSPSTPDGLSIHCVDNQNIKLNWNNASNSSFYKIYYSPTCNYSYSYLDNVYSSSYVTSSLDTCNVCFKIKSCNYSSCSSYSNVIQGKNDIINDSSNDISTNTINLTPSTPNGLSIHCVDNQNIKLNWNNASNSSFYEIYYSPTCNYSYSYLDNVYSSSYVTSSLDTCNVCFKIKSCNYSSCSSYSNVIQGKNNIINNFSNDISTNTINPKDISIEQKITGLYIAYFNRSADKEGLDFWKNRAYLSANSSNILKELSAKFAEHPIFISTYAHLDNHAFVEKIYQNSLGSVGDSKGIEFWTKGLDDGMKRSDMVYLFIEVSLEGKLEELSLNSQELKMAQKRQKFFTNKVNVALKFTTLLSYHTNVKDNNNPETDPAYLASIKIISDVNEDISTLNRNISFLESIRYDNDPIAKINNRDVDEQNKSSDMVVPQNCNAWFDGCNSCAKDSDGLKVCTQRYCLVYRPQDFKCTEWKE